MFKIFGVFYSGEGNLTVLEKVWGVFGLCTMDTQKHGRKEIEPMPQGKKTQTLQDSEANFLRIFG